MANRKHLVEANSSYQFKYQKFKESHQYEDLKFYLVDDLELLKNALKLNTNQYIALDTETTSLSSEHGDLVGISLSFDGRSGLYIPINHTDYKDNLDVHKVLDILVPHLLTKTVYLFNAMFDLRWIEKYDYNLSKLNIVDVQMCCWQVDTNFIPSLKGEEKRYLNWQPIEFNELIPKKSDLTFADLEPTDKVLEYACVDAIGTFLLGELLYDAADFNKNCQIKNATELEKAGSLDHLFLYPLMKMSEEKVKVDTERLLTDSEVVKAKLEEVDAELQAILGEGISLNGGKGRNERLIELGITTDTISDKGSISFSASALENALTKYDKETSQYHIISLLLERAKYSKLANTFYANLLQDISTKGSEVRFSYNTTATNTGRLSASGSGKPSDSKYNPYFANLNIQQMPKPHAKDWFVHQGHSDREGDINIEGYYFSLSEPSDKVIESKEPNLNFRNLFIAGEDEYWLSCDYAAEELRILGNLTGDETWAEAFNGGKDFHETTAKMVWGNENYNADYRKLAKAVNFSLAYGGGIGRIAETTGTDYDTAKEIYNKYMDANKPLQKMWQRLQGFISSKKNGATPIVPNPFGYSRQIYNEVQEGSYTTIMKNCPIQSTAAYVLKRDIVRLYRELLSKPEFKDKIRFQTTVHDEFNFVIKKQYAVEMIERVLNIMLTQFDGWNIPLVADFELGHAWGNLFPFKLVNGKLVPDTK